MRQLRSGTCLEDVWKVEDSSAVDPGTSLILSCCCIESLDIPALSEDYDFLGDEVGLEVKVGF